jgi:hypothetical protein
VVPSTHPGHVRAGSQPPLCVSSSPHTPPLARSCSSERRRGSGSRTLPSLTTSLQQTRPGVSVSSSSVRLTLPPSDGRDGCAIEGHIVTFFVGSRRQCDSAPLMHTFSHHCSRHLAPHRTLAALFQLPLLTSLGPASHTCSPVPATTAHVTWPCIAHLQPCSSHHCSRHLAPHRTLAALFQPPLLTSLGPASHTCSPVPAGVPEADVQGRLQGDRSEEEGVWHVVP